MKETRVHPSDDEQHVVSIASNGGPTRGAPTAASLGISEIQPADTVAVPMPDPPLPASAPLTTKTFGMVTRLAAQLMSSPWILEFFIVGPHLRPST
jgi:hypothetical protein